MAIKAVIFDCFGVLTTEGFRTFCQKFLSGEPGDIVKAQQAMDQLNVGLISNEKFIKTLVELSGQDTEIVRDYLNKTTPNFELFEYIRWTLKPQFKIGILSNAGSDWLDEMFDKKEIGLFDDKLLSFEVKMKKPDPEIYLLSAQRLGVETKECVFVDDIHSYCEAAREVGMKAIWYQNFEDMKQDMEELLSNKS